MSEENVVWIIDNSQGKTIRDVTRFGTPEHIFTDVDTENIDLVEYARDMLSNYRVGDYLCIIGDPKLAFVCAGVIAQNHPGEEVKILQWDSRLFRYFETTINF